MPDPAASGATQESRPAPSPAELRRKAFAVQAVSGLLSKKKPPFGEPPARLPEFPRSLDLAISRLKKPPDLRAKPDRPGAAIGPPAVNLPGGGISERPSEEIPTPADPPGPMIADPAPPGSAVKVGLAANGPIAPPAFPPTSTPVGAAIATPAGPVVRVAPSSVSLDEGQASAGGPRNPGDVPPAVASSLGENVTTPVPNPAGVAGAAPGPPTIRAAPVSFPQDLRPEGDASASEAGPIGPVSPSPVATTPPAGSLPPVGQTSDPFRVRNPLPAGLRGLSEPPPEVSGDAQAPGLDLAGSGPVPAFGSADAHPGGGSVDLSKTNELLRQLIDAVKRQRDGALPAGGPSVYPGR